jgi:hypothetical protein
MADARLEGVDTQRATLVPTAVCRPQWLPAATACARGTVHVILR